mmetsp:Transcript_18576/g.21914  ORF Transcript_18576/g.21914 Transcript_18576/m.21914 type:complete len:583 (-) Transcript_18576:951-2699(-)
MKKIYRFLILTVLLGSTLLYTSCETLELEQTQSPDDATPDQSEIGLFLNSIQIDFGFNMGRFNDLGAQLTRIDYMFGRDYLNNYPPSTMNTIWTEAYQGMFEDIKVMKPQAAAAELYDHVGIAETLQAYTLVSLVDYLGDVPYTEANDSDQFPLPSVDSGASVYQAALNLLTSAENNFNTPSLGNVDVDFFYDADSGDTSGWIKLINTLRMKIYLQTRLVDANAMTNFNAIVTGGNYITSTADDFEFPFGDNLQNPDTRHPDYANNYTASGANSYMSNWLMYTMQGSTGANATFPGGAAASTLPADTRLRYYFTRMNEFTPGVNGTAADLETLQCSLQTAPPHLTGEFANQFCGLDGGYWGRIHGSNEGTPPDGFLRTTYGVYPAAGLFDDNDFEGTVLGVGGGGAGIYPIMLASYVDFMLAEADMIAGGAGEAAALAHVQDGMNKSIAKVQPFADLDISADSAFFATAAQNTALVTALGTEWANGDANGPATTDSRWNLLAEQYFIAQFGAGMDAYNFYRRTGYPTTLSPSIDPNEGNLVRSFFYPDAETSANPNITQKANHDVQVFWDTNPSSPGFPVAN